MKYTKFLFLLAGIFLLKDAYCDILPNDKHYVEKCVLITNLSDFRDLSLLGYILAPGGEHLSTYKISSSDCIEKGYKFNSLEVFAVRKSYISDEHLNLIDLPNDTNAIIANISIDPSGFYVDNEDPLVSIEQQYLIMGFKKDSLILHLKEETFYYDSEKEDSTRYYYFREDASSLLKEIPTPKNITFTVGTEKTEINSDIKIFPNPTKADINIEITNNYLGEIQVSLYSIAGRIIKKYSHYKSSDIFHTLIHSDHLKKETYFLKIEYGEKTEIQKVIIN